MSTLRPLRSTSRTTSWSQFLFDRRLCLLFSAAILVASTNGSLVVAEESAAEDSTVVAPVNGTVDFDAIAATFVAAVEKQSTLKATADSLKGEIKHLKTVTGFSTQGTLINRVASLPSDTRSLALTLQHQNYAPYVDSLTASSDAIHKDVDVARRKLRHARRDLYHRRINALDASSRSNMTARLAVLFNRENIWLWSCGLLAGLTLMLVFGVARRHQFRRLAWVWRRKLWGRVSLLALLILVPLVPTTAILLTGNETYEALLSAGEAPVDVVYSEALADIQQIEAEITREGLDDQLLRDQELHQTANAEWRDGLPKESGDDGSLVLAWEQSRKSMLEMNVDLVLLSDFSSRFEADVAEIQKLDAEVAGLWSGITAGTDSRRRTSGVLGASMLFVYAFVGLVLLSRERTRRKVTRNTCPRCRAVGKLEVNDEGGAKGTEYRCTNVIQEEPQYEECDFIFNEAYLAREKVMFPTLGVTSSGKTHWLAMVYRDLSRGRFPDKVHFSKLKGDAATQMDKLVDGILNDRLNVEGTQTASLPHPLIFDFADNDRLQRSHLLASVTDYAGEAFERDDSRFRDHLLNAEAYLVFLDPTKADETQVKALGDFRQDLQLFRKIPPGKTIHSPVALCVPKIDLMVNEKYAHNSDIIWKFYSELAEIDAATEPLSLDRIQQRSDLVAQIRDVIWPGWPLERQIRDLFGERFMFFPLTPVGLDHPGETDLAKRSIEPYGTLEPLLWLLHMNGYPVLS
jgi:hypothetical protein